jgi:signal transduction histidine kinase
VTAPTLIDRLATHKTVGSAPRQELEWLAAHGTLRQLAEGDVLTPKGVPVNGLFLILSGHIALYLDRGAGRHKVMEWRGGDVTGMLPYSRLVAPPDDTIAQEPSEVFAVPREALVEMIYACHETTSILVHRMLDRSRIFTTQGLHDEKMASLGKLSAGLAHELNNPAAAIERSASLLDERLEDAEQAARALNGASLSEAQFAALDSVRTACGATTVAGVLSPIQRAEREDAISDWLRDHGVDEAIAGPLGETAVTIAALDAVARAVDGPALAAGLRFVAAGCSVRSLASEIQEAAMRISGLVAAVKGFTHMDQAAVAEPVDLRASLANTVAVLNAKARAKSVAVSVSVPADLPRVRGFAGELNQIWANLIDNALDAVPTSGRVDVSAACERQRVVVRVADNGAGIPEDVQSRMFEPFFTTKPVGKGTGLGLDIVRRLLTHNEADIEVDSAPGRTEFRVSLPLADAPRPPDGGPHVPQASA